MHVTELKNVQKIYHVSDIHIRLYQRHKEYREVFDRLYSFLEERRNENAIIVVSGDLFHSKTELSPESVNLGKEFLDTLSSYLPTIVFAGNHDGNMNNKHRMDSITPIIDINNTNLLYYKDSNIYEFKNIAFYLCSVFDEIVKPANELPDNKIKIFLYHGIIGKVQIEQGILENTNLTKDLLDGYDYVLLGDIHKHQILQEKSNNKPYIAYPGSLIQQNFGESLDYHGLIEWDLNNETYTFHEIKNDYGYITINLEYDRVKEEYNIPQKPRVRIKYDQCSKEFLNNYIAKLKKDYDINQVYTIDISNEDNHSVVDSIELADNIYDVNYQNKLITDFCNTTDLFTIPESDIKELLDINKIIAEETEIEINKHIVWKPVELRFSNMFSYGENNVINFTNLDGNIGIIGPNRVGKSSIIDILLFALFDKTSRAYKASEIINVEKDDFKCELELYINEKLYKIEKEGIRKVNKKKRFSDNVPVSIKFYEMNKDGEYIDLSGTARDETNKIIQSYIGSYDDFVMSTISVQNDHMGFLKLPQAERKRVLSRILNIDIFEEYFNTSKLVIRDLKNKLAAKEFGDITQKISDIQTEIYNETEQHQNYKKELVKINKEYDSINKEFKKVMSSYRTIEDFNHNINNILRDLDDHNKKLNNLNNTLNKELDEDNIDELNKSLDEVEALYNKINKDINTHEMNIYKYNNTIKNNLTLSKLHFDLDCTACIDNKKLLISDSLEKEIENAKTNLSSQEAKVVKLKKDLIEIKDLVSELKNNISLIHKNKDTRLEIIKITDKINKLNELKDKYYTLEKDIMYNKEVETKERQIKQQQSKIEREVDYTKSNIIKLEVSIENKHKRIKDLELEEKEYIKGVEQLRLYELYNKIMSKDGIQYHVIQKTIPILENKVNQILSLMTNFTVMFVMDGKDIDIFIQNQNTEEDKYWSIDLCSGLQKFILSLAMRTAISRIGNLPKSEFIAIDEGFGNIDQENLASIGNVFSHLKTIYKYILIISHINTIKNQIDSYIQINKDIYSSVNNSKG